MSSLWTPGGERPVGPDGTDQDLTGSEAAASPTEEELDELRAEMARQLLHTPAEVIVRDHAASFFQLAALHLDQPHPDLEQAAIAIDAMAALLDGLNGRIPDEEALRDALAHLRLAFVQIQGTSGGSDEPVPGDPLG